MWKYLFIVLLSGPMDGFSQKKDQAIIDSLNRLLTTLQKEQTLQRASTLNSLGKIYLNGSDHIHAMQCFSECLAIADKFNNNDLVAASYKNMGVLYFYQHDNGKSNECDSKALAIYQRENNLSMKASIITSMGDGCLQEGDSAGATKYFDSALSIYKKLGDKRGEASIYTNQSILCNGDYQHKIELALAAKNIWEVDKTDNELPTVNTGNIGVAYLDMVRYNNGGTIPPSSLIPAGRKERLELAEKYLKQAIEMSSIRNDVDNSSYFTGVLAELQEQKGDFKNAYYNFRKYQGITDSIFSQENKNKIAALESKRAIDLKNREIENKELQIGNQHKKMWLLISGMAFLVAVGGLLYRQNLTRKKINTTLRQLNNELDEANKVKAKFFGILSHDLRSPVANLINYLQLQKRKPGLMSETQMADREKKIAASATSLLETMEAMLLWSKGQMDHFEPSIAIVEVNSLFMYLRKFFVDVDRVTFTFSCADELSLRSDENYLRTILHNLTANAVKALRQTADAQVIWKAWRKQNDVFLSITDNGPGVADEQLRALYDETVGSGTKYGLGLHIIRDLAKAIGCTIAVQPGQNTGAGFILCIPGRA